MRVSDVVVGIGLVGFALGLSPAASFDGSTTATPQVSPVSAPLPAIHQRRSSRLVPPANIPLARPVRPSTAAQNPFDAFRSGTLLLREGHTDQGMLALKYAADQGVPAALWQLGRIYAKGDGVAKDELRSFEYFRNLTRAHAYDPPGSGYARFVANAFVRLGHYYLEGIPNSPIKPDPEIAHRMFHHAAAHFGDLEAQYQVGKMYLQGVGTPKDGLQAARWLRLAANRGHRGAQALLGTMLFHGKAVARQAALGLFWLTVAKDGAKSSEKRIINAYNRAFAKATEDERAVAYNYLLNWMKSRGRRRSARY